MNPEVRLISVVALLLPLAACLPAEESASPPEEGNQPATVQAPSSEIVRGFLVLGPEVRSIKPCGEETELWVVPTEELRGAYDALSSAPYEPVFVEVSGTRSPAPRDGFGADYSGQVTVRSLRRASPAQEGFGCREDLGLTTFRAAGVEPFWGLRIRPGGITLATPEIPSTGFESVPPVRIEGGWRYLSTSSGAESLPLELTLLREPCTDGMSGAIYSWTATLDIAGDVRRGCAWEGALSPER